MSISSSGSTFPGGARQFATTHWSVVLAAGGVDSPQTRDALGRLCQIYWYPLYVYARRHEYAAQDAQDLTQEFFARLITKKGLAGVERVTRFRAYLLNAFKHFLSNERDRACARKRGGGACVVSLDAADCEARYRVEAANGATPEKLFERRWALALLEQTLSRVEREYRNAGKERLFLALKPSLTGGSRDSAGEGTGVGCATYAGIAAQLNVSEGAVKVAAHRLRQRYRDVLRAEIAETVAHPDEIEDELRCLMSALSNS